MTLPTFPVALITDTTSEANALRLLGLVGGEHTVPCVGGYSLCQLPPTHTVPCVGGYSLCQLPPTPIHVGPRASREGL